MVMATAAAPEAPSRIDDLTAAPSKQERAELAEVLFKCSGPFKRSVSPLLPWPAVLSYLAGELRECRLATRSQEECLHAFALRVEEPATKAFLDDLQRRIRADPEAFGGVKGCVQDDWIEQFQQQVDYVPGISKGKRLIDEADMAQYLELGKQMKKNGNESFATMNFDFAFTRYSQGVELLHNVECRDPRKNKELAALLDALYTNQAIAALRTKNWRAALAACNACLASNPENLKARARRAEARKCLGELDEAQADLSYIVGLKVTDLTTGSAADAETGAALLQAAQKDAIKALGEIQELRKKEREAAKRMMAGADFAEGRRRAGSSKGLESKGDTYEAMMEGLKLQEGGSSSGSKAAPGKATGAGHRKQLSEKLVDEVIALEIQRDLLQLYSQPEVQTELQAMQKAAEYEQGRFLQRLRPYLIKLVEKPILSKYPQLGEGEAGYRNVDRALGQHLLTSTEVKENSKKIMRLLMGDLFEE